METIKPIRTKTDYKMAMKRIDDLIIKNPKKNSKEYDELDVLGTLVSDYETIRFPIAAPLPLRPLNTLWRKTD